LIGWAKEATVFSELGKHSEAIKSYDEQFGSNPQMRLQAKKERRLEGTSGAIVLAIEDTANVSYKESKLCDLWN